MKDAETGTALSSPEYQVSVIREIYAVMAQRPAAVALTEGGLELTYDALRSWSDLIVRRLDSHGIAQGSVVGMHLPRSADAVAAMLGIMAAGCAYLPLDPAHPPARLRAMLDQAGAVAVISAASDPELYGAQRAWLPSPSALAAEPAGLTEPATELPVYGEKEPFGPEACAYILFTSGSTGEPKGVMVSHQNITLMNTWSARFLGITAADATATSCSMSFDASFHETLLPLSAGGTVHVIPHAMALGQLGRPVSLIATTPTVAAELLKAGQLPSLKVLMLGGEVLTRDLAERLLSSGRVGRLLNCYGPTECTVCVTTAEVTRPVPDVIPLGRQVPGVEIAILDEHGRPLPDGMSGEICVFGGQVTPGYVNDPGETAERFALGQGHAAELQRCYRTGDLGYRAADGLIYFGGRADRQVKVNGIRIELGEIDAALRSHPQVSDAVTVARGGDRLVSYVVPGNGSSALDVASVKRHLAARLPRYMLPAAVVTVTDLPTTVNGKLDTSALPGWAPPRAAGGAPAEDDLDELTARVARVIAEVLGFDGQVRRADDFFDDLGGTSLDIVRVLVELERRFGKPIRVNDALADTSVAGLAGLLREESAPRLADFAFNTAGDAPPVFLMHSYLGGMLGLKRVAELLPANQPAYGLHVYQGARQVTEELSIAEVAQNALIRIREVQPAGRVTMVGHSAGGLIAFEAARQILRAGGPEPRVLLMDSPRPFSSLGYYWGELLIYGGDILRHPSWVLRKARSVLSRVTGSRGSNAAAAPPAGEVAKLAEGQLRAIDTAIRLYRAQEYDGSITLLRTRQGRMMAMGRRDLGWASVTRGKLDIIDIPGTHLTMLDEPGIHVVTRTLADWLHSA